MEINFQASQELEHNQVVAFSLSLSLGLLGLPPLLLSTHVLF